MEQRSELFLKNIKLYGYHGCWESEQQSGQEFELDLCIRSKHLDAADDDLKNTLDYQEIIDKLKLHFNDVIYNLLETLAEKILDEILEDERIDYARISLRKKHVPVDVLVDYVEIMLERSR